MRTIILVPCAAFCREYQNEFRERMEEHLAQRCQAAPAGYVVSTEDIQAAVAYAYEQYIEEKKAETLLPPMNAERLHDRERTLPPGARSASRT